MIRNKDAFSLLELIVVISIVAILAAIAVPTYKRYLVISNLAKAKPYVDAAINQLEVRYNSTGSFSGNFTLGSTTEATYSNGTTYAVTGAGPIVTADWRDPSLANATCNSNNSASFAVWMTGLEGIPGYDAPAPGSVSNQSGIYVRLYVTPEGVTRMVCGQHFPSHSASMSIEYSKYWGCDQTDLINFVCP